MLPIVQCLKTTGLYILSNFLVICSVEGKLILILVTLLCLYVELPCCFFLFWKKVIWPENLVP